MALYDLLNVDFEHEDNRGKIIQLIHDGYKQVNVLESKSGVNRGGHFHKKSHEAFYVVHGSVEVELQNKFESEQRRFSAGDFFLIEPYIVHSMYFPEDCLMIQLYNVPVEMEDGNKDIYTV